MSTLVNRAFRLNGATSVGKLEVVGDADETVYYQHKHKCLCCGLHFIVCSDYIRWPKEGTTSLQRASTPREAEKIAEAANCHCPECGNQGPFLHWVEPMDSCICEAVPGMAQFHSFGKEPAPEVDEGSE